MENQFNIMYSQNYSDMGHCRTREIPFNCPNLL